MAPSGLNDTMRAMQGAVHRMWQQMGGAITTGGTVNALTISYDVAPAAYKTSDVFAFISGTTNTGSCTLNVNSLGAKTIKQNGANLTAGELAANAYAAVAYDGTNLNLLWTSAATGTGAVAHAASPTFTGTTIAPTLAGGSATNATLNLKATSSASPSGDSVTITGSTVNLRASSGASIINIGAVGVGQGSLVMAGGGGGTLTFVAGGAPASGTITWPAGTTDFSGTGGASQVVKQTSAGGAFTVGTVANTDISGLGAGVATFLGTPSSANLAAAITDETGAAGGVVFSNGPTLTGVLKAPTIAGGNATNSALVLESVNGSAGSGDSLTLKASTTATFTTLSGTGPFALNVGVANSVSGALVMAGSVSGSQTWQPAGTASGTITWPAGTRDFSASGGANQVVQQSTVGGMFSVGTLASTALSDTTAPASFSPLDASGASLTMTNVSVQWSKVGNDVHIYGTLTYPSTASTANTAITLPVSVPNTSYADSAVGTLVSNAGAAVVLAIKPIQNTTTATFVALGTSARVQNGALTTAKVMFNLTYPAA